MKTKLLLSLTMILLLFAQCKKKETTMPISDDSSDLVKVSFELPINEGKTDFNNILPGGNIAWGNTNNVEYLYLAVFDRYLYYDFELEESVYVGEMFEMQSDVQKPTDKLYFTGMIPRTVLYQLKRCTLYYFGNNGRGGSGTNVTNIYDKKYTDCVIGKTVSFTKQTGDIDELGNYHIASIDIEYIQVIRDENNDIIEFRLEMGELENNMSIAMLDLTDETVLEGPAANLQSYTVKWTGHTYEEYIEYVPNGKYDVSGNPGDKSFIALLPAEDATLRCGKGSYVFENGIEKNHIYLERVGATVEESLPLIWE